MKKMKGGVMKIKVCSAATYFIVLLFIAACNPTKYLTEEEKLYNKGNVHLPQDTLSNEKREGYEEHLEGLLTPKPNKKLLGMRIKLGLYNMGGGPDTAKSGIKRWIKKQGEKPVLLSDVNREYNENLLRNTLENLGFFNAYVTSDTSIDGKFAEVNYNAFPGKIYRIAKVDFEVDSTMHLGRDILNTKDSSLLKVGRNYNLDVILNERDRIDNDLKNKGYYYFSPDNILVEVDSTKGDHQVDMYVTIKPETAPKAKSPQKIGNIFIYPNYKQTSEGFQTARPRKSQLFRNNYYIIDPENTYRKPVLANHIFFHKGDTYNRNDHNMTISHLVNLNAFKFVKNSFVDSPDSANTMDVYYYLTPMQRKALRFEILGKTASVYNGTEANVSWTLRNAFKGFETLSVSVFGGYETQTGGNVNLNSSYIRYGAEVGIVWPRLLSPYKWAPSRRFIPKTYTKVGYEFLNRRNAYTLNSLTMNFGYNWKENEQKQHDLAVAEITYVQPRNITDAYRAQMDTVPTLRHIVDPQFSFGPNYSFTFTNSTESSRKHTFYVKTGLNTSGNVLGLIQGASYKNDNVKNLFGTAYAQFVKAEADFRHYMKLSPSSQLASRIMIGTSYSYGNSQSLPYLKQYFSGGPNGLRSFRARAVGPGTAYPENIGEDNFFADQTGDFKLELNTEYRANITGIFNWAAFIDAGNIWLQRQDDNKPGGKLSKNFYKELAVGGGLGLRFDLDFLIIRTDLAIPFRVPYREAGDRWVFKYIDIRDSEWRKDNLVFNLAIGYPF
ncbi:BamA/TamA family outer membrane protein [Sphingobacterium sp. LRF_L2]|uniref:translocation and assembly module lipoprotein TamL n=1 Tax=Sphingobacterium sp. LRF_L2 TaxID=3369421 RepID=UPI003F5EE287